MKKNLTGGLKREIGLLSATTLVIANMIGTGVFTTPGFIITELGSPQSMIMCWLVGGLFALTGALCYGELGAMLPQAGGEYAYLRRSFGKLPAFLSGWISLIVGFSAPIAAAAIAFSTYLLGSSTEPWYTLEFANHTWINISPASLIAIITVTITSIIHYHSVHLGQNVQNLLTTFKILFIIGFVTCGFWFGSGEMARISEIFTDNSMKFDGNFAISLIFVSFAYSGWNAAAYLGGEIRRPERNLPLALIIGTVLVIVLYILLNMVFIYALPTDNMKGALDLGYTAAKALFGQRTGNLISYAIAFGLLSVISAMIMAGPRVYYAMACDNLFFKCFKCVDEHRKTPGQAIIFQAVLAIAIILSTAFDTLLIYIGFTLSISSIATISGLIKLRLCEPNAHRPYKTFLYPFTPILFIAGNTWIVVHSLVTRPIVAAYGLATISLGVLAFLFFKTSPSCEGEWLNNVQTVAAEEKS